MAHPPSPKVEEKNTLGNMPSNYTNKIGETEVSPVIFTTS